jgi:formamidopyrimidine-DNA glycosylase
MLFVERQCLLQTNVKYEFADQIIGSNVKSIETYGKNIVIVFSNGLYLRNHMLIWGKWKIYDRWEFEEGKIKAPPHSKLKSQIPQTNI